MHNSRYYVYQHKICCSLNLHTVSCWHFLEYKPFGIWPGTYSSPAINILFHHQLICWLFSRLLIDHLVYKIRKLWKMPVTFLKPKLTSSNSVCVHHIREREKLELGNVWYLPIISYNNNNYYSSSNSYNVLTINPFTKSCQLIFCWSVNEALS